MKFSLLEKIRPEFLFLSFSLFFGLIILSVTPPFQVPDEINHFYKAYQISEGNFISIKQDKRLGGYIPQSLVKITEPFLGLRWNNIHKTSKKIISEQLKIPLNPGEKTFVDFPNTGLYCFVSYIPQALFIFIGRAFSLSPLWLFYLARLGALLFWVISIFYAIKIIPIYKWLFCLLALLPMSVYINMSLSADVVTNALTFVLIAFILKLSFSGTVITTKHFIFLLLLSIVLAIAKIVYMPLIFIFLIVPKGRFINKNDRYLKTSVLFLVSLLSALVWSKMITDFYVPYSSYNPAYRDNATLVSTADMHLQLNYIITHGLYFFKVICNSLGFAFNMYYDGYIGTFGWLDTPLPKWLIHFSYVIIFVIAILNNKQTIRLSGKNKLVFLFSFLASFFLLLLSQHLTWDAVGGDIIATIQGRYLIPMLPLVFMLCYNVKFNFSRFVPLIAILFSMLALYITTHTLLSRYY